MKKLMVVLTLLGTLLSATPAFAHTVQKGDTMSQIARDYHLSLQELAKLNPQVEDLDLIYIGQTVHTGNPEQATLQQNQEAPKEAETQPNIQVGYSHNEVDLLARLVRAEAEIEPYDGKIAVACVVLNRVESKSFPNTIKDVIYQKRQFQPVQNGQINKPADEDSIKAVQEALKAKRNLVGSSLFFYNPAIATSRWLDSRPTTHVIGHHVFKN